MVNSNYYVMVSLFGAGLGFGLGALAGVHCSLPLYWVDQRRTSPHTAFFRGTHSHRMGREPLAWIALKGEECRSLGGTTMPGGFVSRFTGYGGGGLLPSGPACAASWQHLVGWPLCDAGGCLGGAPLSDLTGH